MKILLVCTIFYPATIYGGPATVALQHARGLVRRGHDVTVATSDIISLTPEAHVIPPKRTIDSVEVNYFSAVAPMSRIPTIYSRSLGPWLHQHVQEYDLVHVHFAREWIPVTAARVSLRARVPLFLQSHGMLNRRDGVRTIVDRVITRKILERASQVLVLQAHERDTIAEIAPRARITELPNGIAISPTRPRWGRNALEGKTVLFLARLHPRKRVLDFIEMARLLQRKRLGLRFRIVGPDGGELPAARQLVMDYGLMDSVEFAGPIPHEKVAETLAQASVYVLPSVDEPFPMSVLEALAAGTPTIVTTGIHIGEILRQNAAASVVAPDPDALADSVERLIGDPEYAWRLSQQGQRLVERELTLDRVLDRLETIYTSHIG